MNNIGERIRAARIKNRLTQMELAGRAGIGQGCLSRIERGTRSPTTRVLQRIADALGADLTIRHSG